MCSTISAIWTLIVFASIFTCFCLVLQQLILKVIVPVTTKVYKVARLFLQVALVLSCIVVCCVGGLAIAALYTTIFLGLPLYAIFGM